MEAEEIENWYAIEKEKLTKNYTKLLKHKSNQNIEKERPVFRRRMKKLISDYNKHHENRVKHEKRRKKMRYPIEKFKSFMDCLSDMFNERGQS